ncbi:MAG: Rpn family recombination-promoting nuclease/putative transposase [Runella slithyformis]|nr:MAG: Rpn family recombination-promoting nuclease/putative transposase [Runella slithyformis]
MTERPLISFDWALKKLLRNQANFVILEGFLSTLLKKDIVVISILESESNPDYATQKTNRVDLLVENEQKERIIVELQYNDEYDYFQRMLYATSKHIINNFQKGNAYGGIKKVYSINLIYFDLGQGSDYVYHGKNEFKGIHQNDILGLSARQKDIFKQEHTHQIYPEYYVIKINNFDDVAKDSLDEWIYYFKNDEIKEEFKAKGLAEVREHLRLEQLSKVEKRTYERYLEDLSSAQSMIFTAEGLEEGRAEGLEEGRAEGLEEGRAEGALEKALETAKKMKEKGFSTDDIADITGLSRQEISDGL